MAHSLMRLTGELYGTPHLISLEGFKTITNYLDLRNANLASFPQEMTQPKQEKHFDVSAGIAVIPIHGATTYRETAITAMCGLASYEGILNKASEAIEAGVKTIVLDLDSGGGSAQGCFSSANELRKMCDDSGVSLIGFVDGSCCSAAYALGCVCDELIADPHASVGSIGVLIGLTDASEKDKMEGVSTVYITDGKNKVPFDKDGKFKSEFLEDLQKKVSYLGDEFRKHVNFHTSIPVENLKNTQAKVFMANEALELGLITSIMPKSDFISYVVKGKTNAK
jgi:ClpP class serine protease